VPAKFLVPLPQPLTPRQAMIIGTAGYTAMLCVQALERLGVGTDAGEILVTGANGGVGGFAITLLARRGYRVVASTGRLQESERLRALGAAQVIDRASLAERASRCRRSAGPAWSTAWAATRWPTPAPARSTAAWSRPAGWPRAWTCPRRWRRSSCAA